VKERAAGATSAIDDRFGEKLDVLAVVGFVVRYVIDEAAPPAPDADDPVSITQRADGDCSYCGIETWDVTTTGQNPYRTFRQLRLLAREGMTRVGFEPTTYGLKVRCSTN
jgi:hypothetical protein